ncbi:MAG: cytochrome c3 family protein [Candidatus Kryptonium sp.]
MKKFWLLIIFVFFFFEFSISQIKNERCLICHGVKNFGIAEGGKFISLYVSKKDYETSVHGKFACVSCHVDVRVIPHLTKLRKIHCLQCHFEDNVVGAPVAAKPEKYKESIHGRTLAKGKSAPDCKDCHTVSLCQTDSEDFMYQAGISCQDCHSGEKNLPARPSAEICGACHEQSYVDDFVGKQKQLRELIARWNNLIPEMIRSLKVSSSIAKFDEIRKMI